MKFILAILISFKAHKGQVDKGERPYIFHPLNVMIGVKGYKEKIVALLHDVVEDSDYTLNDLQKYFDREIVEAVNCITKKKYQKYEDYLNLVKNNKLARVVKISDIKHNMRLERLKEITENDLKRNAKYKKALNYLENL